MTLLIVLALVVVCAPVLALAILNLDRETLQ